MDLGCGNGASILGLIDCLYEKIDFSKMRSIMVDIVDYSHTQLEIFEDTTRIYIEKKYGTFVHFNKYLEDIDNFLNTKKNVSNYNIILVSNVFSEIPIEKRTNIVIEAMESKK